MDAYVNTYLKEEVKAESLVQNITHFSRFLRVAVLANFLCGRTNLNRNDSGFGKAFEHFITMETAIEVKSTTKVNDKHLSGLRALREEGIFKKMLMVSFDELDRQTEDGCLLLHWRSFLTLLWDKNLELSSTNPPANEYRS